MIKPAALAAKFNSEPQNIEGWCRFAQSFFKIDRIHHFDIHYSIFAFSGFLSRLDWPFFWPAPPLLSSRFE
jgi:hypothetical protein